MFFIFSLPRSGSAWLSQFLTGRDSFCYHELTVEPDFAARIWKRPETFVGAVDTGAYHFPLKVYDAFPNAQYFTLIRDRSEITESSARCGIAYDAALAQLPAHAPIYYSKFHDAGYLKDVWSQVVGPGFDSERTKYLLEMNIQRDFGKFLHNRPYLTAA